MTMVRVLAMLGCVLMFASILWGIFFPFVVWPALVGLALMIPDLIWDNEKNF